MRHDFRYLYTQLVRPEGLALHVDGLGRLEVWIDDDAELFELIKLAASETCVVHGELWYDAKGAEDSDVATDVAFELRYRVELPTDLRMRLSTEIPGTWSSEQIRDLANVKKWVAEFKNESSDGVNLGVVEIEFPAIPDPRGVFDALALNQERR